MAQAVWAGARRHLGLVIVLVVGALARLLIAKAYQPALWFNDFADYLLKSDPLTPGGWHPSGFSAWLRLLAPFGGLDVVTAVQHVIGLSLAVLAYALLQRRGAARWLSLVAAAPLALDARLIVLEHYLIADALFLALLVGGLVLLLWRERPGAWLSLGAGLLLGTATLVRVVGLPLCILIGGYLLVRRLGWRALLGYTAAMLVTLGGYSIWFHSYYHEYGLTRWGGRFLYARTAHFADCDRLRLTDIERTLCPPQPLGQRPERPDWYMWDPQSPAQRYPSDEDDPMLKGFAVKVITQQPGDYARAVGTDMVRYFLYPSDRLGPKTRCLGAYWDLGYRVNGEDCFPHLAVSGSPAPASLQRPVSTRSRTIFQWYARVAVIPGPVQLLIVLAVAVATFWRPRWPGWRDGLDALLLTACGVAMIAVSFATSTFDKRYGFPAVPLLVLAAAFAWRRLRARTRVIDMPVQRERSLDAGDPA